MFYVTAYSFKQWCYQALFFNELDDWNKSGANSQSKIIF